MPYTYEDYQKKKAAGKPKKYKYRGRLILIAALSLLIIILLTVAGATSKAPQELTVSNPNVAIGGEQTPSAQGSSQQNNNALIPATETPTEAPTQGGLPDDIDPDKPMIALTFDDGPGDGSSDRILDVLEANGAKATFFMVGYIARDNPANVQRKAALGMEIGNHTWDHGAYGSDVPSDSIQRTTTTISDVAGVPVTCFRSPGGMTTDNIIAECTAEGIPIYYWSIDTEDWASRDADAVYHKVMDQVKDGDIILMHEIYDSTAEAVERMVPELIAQGYQLVTCEQLIRAKTGEAPQPGVEYVSGTETMNW